MTDKIISLAKARGDLSPDEAMENAKGHYESCVVIGYSQDGNIDAFATVSLDRANILWLIEQFKLGLLDADYGD